MSTTTYRRRSHREASSADSARTAGQDGSAHLREAGDGVAYLDVLAAHLHARGWTAYISAPAGRLTSLFVQGPHHHAECGDIIVTPDSAAGDWWYWFSWAERIAPVHAPAAAADAIIRACQRPADGSQTPQAPRGERSWPKSIPPQPSSPLAWPSNEARADWPRSTQNESPHVTGIGALRADGCR